jgi:hypothetical protein
MQQNDPVKSQTLRSRKFRSYFLSEKTKAKRLRRPLKDERVYRELEQSAEDNLSDNSKKPLSAIPSKGIQKAVCKQIPATYTCHY